MNMFPYEFYLITPIRLALFKDNELIILLHLSWLLAGNRQWQWNTRSNIQNLFILLNLLRDPVFIILLYLLYKWLIILTCYTRCIINELYSLSFIMKHNNHHSITFIQDACGGTVSGPRAAGATNDIYWCAS